MALPGIETGILRAAGKAVGWLVPKAREAHRRRDIRENARTLTPLAISQATIAELDGDRQARLANFIATPDFEQLALQLAVAETQTGSQREELVNAVQVELWHGLKRAIDIEGGILYGVREAVFDALRLAVAVTTRDTMSSPSIEPATVARLVAAAVHNCELLGAIEDLAQIHAAASALRHQVTIAHADIRMPHTGVHKAVPWSELYVAPSLTSVGKVGSLLEPGERTVILGDPGAGKSTLTEKLAYDVASSVEDQRVPFRVVLRDLSGDLRTAKVRLAEHLARTAEEPYNVVLGTEAVEYLLLNGRAVVILDGLDELIDVTLRSRLVKLIDSFAAMYPTVPIVVTSRKIGYRNVPLHPNVFTSTAIANMSAGRVSRYARNWFALDESRSSQDRIRLHESFMAESESIQDLRANPLLLSLLCATYSAERFIPRNRTQVYEKCALLIFEGWDRMRGIEAEHRFHGHVRGAVQELAWKLFTESDTAELARPDVKRILVSHLTSRGFTEEDADHASESFLNFCAGRAWVLAEVGSTTTEPIYGFAHRTFLEFFAAERLVRHCPEPSDLWGIIGSRIANGAWEVMSQLALQLLD